MTIRSGIHLIAACLTAILIALIPITAFSDTTRDDDDAREHYEAQQALKSGKIRPLEEIIATVRKEIPGDIIEIEFENDDGRYIYEMEIIQPSGQIIEIEIDATTKVILGREDS
ncbi:peptidase [Metarhizobium album]|uniref:Peptidase n=1 Tax=Metarhizobium album TaxID=2182425 RepID=A0A2U2DRY2_9HYPH|nr:PepSY domain-containing protein [Rhizobium album]OJU01213.1 MAG: hypothetical protein BGN83_06485 [Rhizobium sp. 63-7]PWE55979.1 peptidase [Rhizobium album]